MKISYMLIAVSTFLSSIALAGSDKFVECQARITNADKITFSGCGLIHENQDFINISNRLSNKDLKSAGVNGITIDATQTNYTAELHYINNSENRAVGTQSYNHGLNFSSSTDSSLSINVKCTIKDAVISSDPHANDCY